ncbi:hypothetical protein ACHQM5_022414 [Ranunculus cassubicifolius]
MAAKLFILFALCISSMALVTAVRPLRHPFELHGNVICDTCKCGFETLATTYIKDAKIKVECRDRKTLELRFEVEATTNEKGAYVVTIAHDHYDDLCEAALVSSPQENCAKPMLGRERSRVILTNNNGIISNTRFANNMAFVRDEPLAGCAQVLKLYEVDV